MVHSCVFHTIRPLHRQYLYFTAKIAAQVRNFIPNLNLRVILQSIRDLQLSFQHFRTKMLQSIAQQAEDARDAQ